MGLNADRALAELCRRSFYRFIQEFWEVIIPEKPVWNWHIKYLADELQYLNSFVEKRQPKPYDLVINIPPGSTKSTIATQMYNAWVWPRDPAQRIISSSYSHMLSVNHAVKTRDIIISDKYAKLFPEVKLKFDQQAKSDFFNESGGQRFATSSGGTVTGVHAHQIIVDDPINPGQALSTAERTAANYFTLSTLSTRKVDKAITPMVLIMQRLHESDPTGELLNNKKKKIKHINLPAEDKGNVVPVELKKFYVDGLLDPIRLNKNVLEEALEDLGSYGYAGQYSQNPAPEAGGLIKKHWFEIIPWKVEYNQLVWNFIADTAFTAKETNDPSGYIAYTVYQGDFIIRKAEQCRLEFTDLCRALESFAYQHGYSRRSIFEIEPKANGKSLVQVLKRQTKLNVKEGTPPDKDKEARVKGASPTMEAGRVKLIQGDWNVEYINQLSTFPNAKHDEWVDCTTMMIGDTKPNKKKPGVQIRN